MFVGRCVSVQHLQTLENMSSLAGMLRGIFLRWPSPPECGSYTRPDDQSAAPVESRKC